MNDIVDVVVTPFYGIIQTLFTPPLYTVGVTVVSLGGLITVMIGVSLFFRLFTK